MELSKLSWFRPYKIGGELLLKIKEKICVANSSEWWEFVESKYMYAIIVSTCVEPFFGALRPYSMDKPCKYRIVFVYFEINLPAN